MSGIWIQGKSAGALAVILVAATLTLAATNGPPASANTGLTRQVASPVSVTGDALSEPGATLAPGWRSSPDEVVAVVRDAAGLQLLAASAADGYAWRTVATLAVSGTETTEWIGQACLTGTGRAVVVYAPRQITNSPDAIGYGAIAAVVDLATGHVSSRCPPPPSEPWVRKVPTERPPQGDQRR